eukprot:4492365-Pyramimonas_sp.AAC.1
MPQTQTSALSVFRHGYSKTPACSLSTFRSRSHAVISTISTANVTRKSCNNVKTNTFIERNSQMFAQ